MSRAVRSLALLACFAAGGSPAAAQDDRVIVTVRDSTGRAVPYAFVQQVNGATRTADDSGRAELRVKARDSLQFVVRRIGFEPYTAWVVRSAAGDYPVVMAPLVQSLKAARIIAHTNDMLVRNRFYDRMERVKKGAISALFITPEELDLRNPARISQMLQGHNIVKVQITRGRAMVLGRTLNCSIDVLLDGRRIDGLIQEFYTRRGQQQIADRAREVGLERATHEFLIERLSIDELIVANSVTAIEVYASAASAPPELQQNMRGESCGLVVLWTGSRR